MTSYLLFLAILMNFFTYIYTYTLKLVVHMNQVTKSSIDPWVAEWRTSSPFYDYQTNEMS